MVDIVQQIDALAQQVGADIKALLAEIAALQAADGNLATLSTTAKSSLVAALNEVKAGLDAVDVTSVIDDTAAAGTAVTWSASRITTQIQTAIDALVAGAPGTLDTLNELATALQANDGAINALLSGQAKRVAVDAPQSFTATEQAQARANMGAAAQADLDALEATVGTLGTADFVAAYQAAKAG